ncbi:hypothetical protein GJ744_001286 [Endocarpon pusillum]|uniref:MADS-box domain-containing protein n=1 Tax=Endocarpon pusillum TaxID=364733 RepID=A0A8H7ACB0_9EURO|nr:hypothetical protein GJ744_001286 [Endocarpon pusillum]
MTKAIRKRYCESGRGQREKFSRRQKSLFKKLFELNEVCGAKCHVVLQRNNKFFVFTSEEDTESWPPPLAKIKQSYPPPTIVNAKDYGKTLVTTGLSNIIPVLSRPEESPVEVRAPEHALLGVAEKSTDTQECPRNESLWRKWYAG